MNHRILGSVASAIAATPAAAVAPTPVAAAPAPAPAAPAADASGETVDVVTLETAQQHGREQFAAGSTAERQRTADVFASDAGKANPQMAAFMLANNPTANAAAITASLAAMPAAAAPAAAKEPATPPAPTADLNQTPKVVIQPSEPQADAGIDISAEIEKAIAADNASVARPPASRPGSR